MCQWWEKKGGGREGYRQNISGRMLRKLLAEVTLNVFEHRSVTHGSVQLTHSEAEWKGKRQVEPGALPERHKQCAVGQHGDLFRGSEVQRKRKQKPG